MGWSNLLRNNTRLERKLIFFVALLCAVVLVLFIILLSSTSDHNICDSPECVRAATHILDTVDPSIDPCSDFYKFACGTFLKNAFSLGQPSTLHPLRELVKNNLKEIVIEKDTKQHISKALQMQRKFYQTCINETIVEEDGDRTFLSLLDEVMGGWPVVKEDKWNDREFDWINAMMKARKLGFFYQFYFRVEIYYNSNDTTSNLWIKPPDRTDVDSFLWRDENLEIMSQIASDLGARSIESTRKIGYTLHFAEQLNLIVQKYYNNTENNVPDVRRQSSIKDLQHSRIKIDWLNVLRNLTGLDLKETDIVVFDVDGYFTDLYHLLIKTPRKIQANYMAWAIILTNVQYMTKQIRDKHKKMKTSSNQTESDLSRSDVCYTISKDLFRNIAEAEYVRRFTAPANRDYVREMIETIKLELQLVLEKTNWMDEETKSYAIKHLQNITEEIGWTKLVYDAQKFEKYFGYHRIKMVSAKLVDMARLMVIKKENYRYQELKENGSDVEQDYLNTPRLDVNAYYMKFFNKLVLPTPILQGFVFNQRRPAYMNYGSIGSIIGHEFMHGVIEYSAKEKLDEDTWWTNTTIRNFKSASRCLVEDYKTYLNTHDFQFQTNNETVFEENLADFAGVNLAYKAYVRWIQKHTWNEKLPGMKFNPSQLFWIMTSTYLCYEPRLLETGESKKNLSLHAIPNYRIIGRLRNSPHFARDFNCPLGSHMNPENKCKIFG